ncbi:TPA: hypothetical protein SJ425_000073 [Yersinia enterocolitica]|uniref:hypothetical protein n=1 Tax=Yersinia enterocolitica TaxID=630 RepID=UPI0021E89DE0|nr:hypothetical protein [Yersinia enterocolitica]UYJ99784.1 hypothetical protein N4221_11145 [Yersinia enterocolitica]HEI6705258.1 hypothetical protein [Yersinia enterocolitica]HEI6706390.1 hypothetical protein [Yersinia enterocolitica]HEI6832307.1 hypothetical protein [Yersinia enterocolitica]
MSNYALVNEDGLVVNTVVWDGKSNWSPPLGQIAIKFEIAGIGWTYVGGEFISPPTLTEKESTDVA